MASTLFEGFFQAATLILRLDPKLIEITARSVAISGLATLLASCWSLPLGVLIGLGSFRGRVILKGVFNTLLGVPTVTLGLLLYLVFSRSGPLGFLHILYSPSAIIIGHIGKIAEELEIHRPCRTRIVGVLWYFVEPYSILVYIIVLGDTLARLFGQNLFIFQKLFVKFNEWHTIALGVNEFKANIPFESQDGTASSSRRSGPVGISCCWERVSLGRICRVAGHFLFHKSEVMGPTYPSLHLV